jgi:hypothetical protein
MPSTRIYYDEHGRAEVPTRNTLRTVLIVVAVVILLWIIGYILFNVGGTIPGTGLGDVFETS